MKDSIKILFVEDVRTDAELIWRELEKNGIVFEKLLVDSKKDFLRELESFSPDMIISDYSLPQFNGMEALIIRNEKASMIPFILVTGSLNEEVAVECMKAGADDYILKENLSRLVPAVINSLDKAKLLKGKKIAEEELLRSELRLQKAQSIAHIGNWELDLSTKTVWVSEEALRIYGFENKNQQIPLEIVQNSPLPEFRAVIDEAFDRLLKYNEPYEVEFDIQSVSDGEIRSIYSKAELVQESDSTQVKVVGVIQDITVHKKTEEALIRAKEKAEESDRLKTAFLHNISHEIRTPMNAIVGFATLLAEPDVDAESRQSYTEVIMQSSNHLLSIITDIVDISNIEAHLAEAARNEVNVNSILRRLYDQYIINARRMNLGFSCQTGLSDPDANIITDGTKLTQIISNLINNALKFTSAGFVRFGYKVNNDLLEFFVIDTGIGIPEAHHSLIFDRFYQVETKKSRLYEGTGLGLAITKAYVELLGGTIWLSSEPGKGASFFFTIPLEKQAIKVMANPENEVADGFVFPVNKTILVAEDIDSNFKLISYFLSKSNVSILRANNGKEAVDKVLAGDKIDLVLMDIKMPVMDGFTAIKLIRETNQTLPIIAQTAYVDDYDTAIEAGCNGFIKKPFDKKGLFKVINGFI